MQATIKCPVHPDTLAKVSAGLLTKKINIEAESLKVMTSRFLNMKFRDENSF